MINYNGTVINNMLMTVYPVDSLSPVVYDNCSYHVLSDPDPVTSEYDVVVCDSENKPVKVVRLTDADINGLR